MVRAHIQVVCLGLEFVVSLYKSTLRTFSNMGTSARLAHEDVPIGPGTAGTDGVISVVQSVPTVRRSQYTENGAGGDDGYGAESLNVAAEGHNIDSRLRRGQMRARPLSQKARHEPPSRSTASDRGTCAGEHEAGRPEKTPVLTSGLAGTIEFGGRH